MSSIRRISLVALAAALAFSCGGAREHNGAIAASPTPDLVRPDSGTVGTGLPATGDADGDRDGIRDLDDECPTEAEDIDGFEDANGCPDPDNDNDRIPDIDDKCPVEPEVYNGREDEDGCPDRGLIKVDDIGAPVALRVDFQRGESVVQPVSYDVLASAARVLMDNTIVGLVAVVGHASDDEGSRKKKTALSEERARAVAQRLIDAGVAADRLAPLGLGNACPLREGHDQAIREMNRRVEFKILVLDGNCTEVAFACDAAIGAGLLPEALRMYLPGPKACMEP